MEITKIMEITEILFLENVMAAVVVFSFRYYRYSDKNCCDMFLCTIVQLEVWKGWELLH